MLRQDISRMIVETMRRRWIQEPPSVFCFDFSDESLERFLSVLSEGISNPDWRVMARHLVDCCRCRFLYGSLRGKDLPVSSLPSSPSLSFDLTELRPEDLVTSFLASNLCQPFDYLVGLVWFWASPRPMIQAYGSTCLVLNPWWQDIDWASFVPLALDT
jgi:hypothetical protein